VKKILLTILTFLYLLLSTGIAMEIHYCMGEKAGVDFFGKTSEKCGKCGMTEKKGGCCSDVHKFVKYENAFKHPNAYYAAIPFEAIVSNKDGYFNWNMFYPVEIQKEINYTPPDFSSPPIYIKQCVFRI